MLGPGEAPARKALVPRGRPLHELPALAALRVTHLDLDGVAHVGRHGAPNLEERGTAVATSIGKEDKKPRRRRDTCIILYAYIQGILYINIYIYQIMSQRLQIRMNFRAL